MFAHPVHSSAMIVCEYVCVCVHIRSTGADCFDVISPALMNPLICLTTPPSWRAEERGNTINAAVATASRRSVRPLHIDIFMLCLQAYVENTCAWCAAEYN